MRHLFIVSSTCIALILNGCASQSSSLVPADNVAEFATNGGYNSGIIAHDVLKRAAYTTQRRGYTHFTIATIDPTQKGVGINPSIGIGYGRDLGGFSMGSGFGVGAGIMATSSPRTRWKVVMYKTNGANMNASRGQRLYNAAEITR